MDNYLDLVKSTSKNYADHLLKISENKELQFQSFTIKADQICNRDWLNENILDSIEFGNEFKKLIEFKDSPVLYIVEFENTNNHSEIKAAINKFISSDSERAFPAISNNRFNNENTNILYVGKVVRDFYGRVIQHMGYFRGKKTQGLQLCYWIPDIKLDVTFKYLVLHPEIGDFLSSIEYAVANNLNPLLGKHK